jgi:hypothetical protein
MAMIGVRVAALGLALAVLCPSPQASAFGIRLGPFLLLGGGHIIIIIDTSCGGRLRRRERR